MFVYVALLSLVASLFPVLPVALPTVTPMPMREQGTPATGVTEAVPGEAVAAGADEDWFSAVQEYIQATEYALTWSEQVELAAGAAAWTAPNRAQNLRSAFTADGVRITQRSAPADAQPWTWGLTLAGYGTPEQVLPAGPTLGEPLALTSVENRITYTWESAHGTINEWFVNDVQGVKQNFTLFAPPVGLPADTLALDLRQHGPLLATVHADGQGVDYRTAAGELVLHYSGLYVYDAAGRTLPAQISARADGLRISVDARNASYPITVDPLATTPAWGFESNQIDAELGTSVATAGDVNGDGFSDVIVGAPLFDTGVGANAGQVYIFHGSATGLSLTPNRTLGGATAGEQLGYSVATAGDVNGDGFSDVIIGAHLATTAAGANAGQVTIYYGSATGIGATPDVTLNGPTAQGRFGWSVAAAGDIDGDGFGDVIIGQPFADVAGNGANGQAFLYRGASGGLDLTPAIFNLAGGTSMRFGHAVASAGDVNGDGFSDVIIGANRYVDGALANAGGAFIYHGSATGLSATPVITLTPGAAQSEFGYSVATAGDVNGDGYADVIIGARFFDNPTTDVGRAYLYYGSATGIGATPAWTVEGTVANDNLGLSVATAGDVNGDGYADIIVGTPLFDTALTNVGRVSVYLGGPTGPAITPDWQITQTVGFAQFGHSVATAGDVNGDGFSDVIIGARRFNGGQNGEGRAFVYYGNSQGLGTTASWGFESDLAEAQLGFSVASAGDVNGDGFSDVIVGAPFVSNGNANEGRIYLFNGSANGLSTTPSFTAELNLDNAQLGFSVASAGDVNGDGYSDVIVGAPGANRALIYLGGPSGLAAPAAWDVTGSDGGRFGASVASAGDVNGDGFSDLIIGAPIVNVASTTSGGAAYIYHGGPNGPAPTASFAIFNALNNTQLGFSVASAGDVNGDGFSDVVIGSPFHTGALSQQGRAIVLRGSATGVTTIGSWEVLGNAASANLGWSVASAGDVNGDGFSDVIIGVPAVGAGGAGRADIFHGSAAGLSATANTQISDPNPSSFFGFSVASAGDTNGDGFSDVIVGTPFYANGQAEEGAAFLFRGGASGITSSAAWTVESNQIDAQLGYAVASAGDVNGDGYADVIVGASNFSNGQANEGAAFAYYGNRDGRALQPQARRSSDTAPIDLRGRSDSEDSFRVAANGISPFGRGLVRLEVEVQPLGTPFTGTPTVTSDWTDSTLLGATFSELIEGLTIGTSYTWRARIGYNPVNLPFQTASRWFTSPGVGQRETRVRLVDTTPPDVTVEQAATQADPTNTSPINFVATFSEPITVSSFTGTDVTLGGTAPGTLSAVITQIAPNDGTTFNIAVSGMTGNGTVTASIPAGVVTDLLGNANTASTSTDNEVTFDIISPTVTVNQGPLQEDPTRGSPINFVAVFSEPIDVSSFTAADVTLGGTAPGTLTATILEIAPNDGTTFNIAVSGMTGSGTVTATIAASAVTDPAGNGNTASTSTDNVVTYDITAPTVTVNQALSQADPTNASPITFVAVFSEPITVSSFTGADVTLGGTAPGTLSAVITQIAPNDGTTFSIAVSGMTGSGTVTASIAAGVVTDVAGNDNLASTSTDNVVTYDVTAPTVTVNQASGQDDPTNASPITFVAVFSEPIDVSSFTAADITFGGTAPGTLVAVISEIAPNDGTTFNLAVSGMAGSGTVTASIAAGVVTDVAGNANIASTSTDNEVTYAVEGPIPVITQATGQADPTNLSPITFLVSFNEPINVSSFTAADLELGGTAPGTLSAVITQIAPNDGTTFTVAISGMTGDGTVTLSIPAGVLTDPVGNLNIASVNTDNSVTYDITPPAVTVNQAPDQVDPTDSSPITFRVVFSEPIDVSSFTEAALTFGGTAPGARTATINELAPNDGTTFDVAISGMSGGGTVTLSIAANVLTDAAGNGNSASTSTDNEVTYVVEGPSVTVNQAPDQADPTNESPIRFVAVFSEPIDVSSFIATDVTITGTAPGTLVAAISELAPNDGTTFAIAISGMSGSGNVIVSLAAGVVTDLEGNGNAASSSTDNVVTFTADDPQPAGFRLFLPLMVAQPLTAPDLIVEEVLVAGEDVRITIRNIGETIAVDPFWVDLYIDPTTVPTGTNQIWQTVGTRGAAWGVTAILSPGQAVTLTVGDVFFNSEQSNLGGPIAAGTPIYVQVDSANELTDFGAVREEHEIRGLPYNNIAATTAQSGPLPPAGARPSALTASAGTLPTRPRE
jgi:hypothetical protein